MGNIKCPSCGSSMVLRTAKRGPRAGNKFYGCSRYPRCKETAPFDSEQHESSPNIDEQEETLNLTKDFYPRNLIARERFKNYQVRCFETVAVPGDLLETIRFGEINEEILKALSQWRIDFPIIEQVSEYDERQRQIISVLEKILIRGRITLLSPWLEEKSKSLYQHDDYSEDFLSEIEQLAVSSYRHELKKIWFDSKEEELLYYDILPKLIGNDFDHFVLTQVDITSLLPPNYGFDSTNGRRIDFAIFHPNLKQKIIVEIDGKQHQKHIASDKERDEILQQYGFTIIRIQAEEIRRKTGQKLDLLASKLASIKTQSESKKFPSQDKDFMFFQSIKLSQQIQIALLQAIQSNFINLRSPGTWYVISDLDEIGLIDEKIGNAILKNSVNDLIELFRRLCNLYSYKLEEGEPHCSLFSNYKENVTANAIFISFTDKFYTELPTFHIQGIYFPYNITNSTHTEAISPLVEGLEVPEEKDLQYFLQYLFRKPSFWEGQYDGIVRAFQGKDALLLLPTGAGKSLIYQLVSLLLPGRTIVIDPIISLMEDQVDNLALAGIDRCIAITHLIEDPEDKMRAIQLVRDGEYLFTFVSPERFQTVEFRDSLRGHTVHTPIALIVIDEAHCVSEWGHDFRTAYLNIGRTTREYCSSDDTIPPLVALTGTASRAVLKDVQRELQIEEFDAIITPKSFDRSELNFGVINAHSQEKATKLKGLLKQKLPNLFNIVGTTLYQPRGKNTHSGLIFCPHIGGEFGVEKVSQEIREDLGIYNSIYSGREPKNWDSSLFKLHKHRVTREFKRNKIPVLVCTKAFGMGIDKPNIRFTVHFGIPPSLESFYQEAGRAGRDRKASYCYIIVSNDDSERSEKLLNTNTSIEEIDDVIRDLEWDENDDITRVLFFHTFAFKGVAEEKQNVEKIIQYLGNIEKKGKKTLNLPNEILAKVKRNSKRRIDVHGQAMHIVEKALHRLLIIGVISDYTINYSSKEFTIPISGARKEKIIENYGNYVSGFIGSKRKEVELQKATQLWDSDFNDFVLSMVGLLLEFIYKNIEKGRRRALEEILICSRIKDEDDFRNYINTYFGRGDEFSEHIRQTIEDILSADDVGFSNAKEIIEDMDSLREATEIRGAMARSLESYPDQPALLMLRAISEIFTREKDYNVVKRNFIASISSAITNYGMDEDAVFEFGAWAISKICQRAEKLSKELIFELFKAYPNRHFARSLLKQLPKTLLEIPAWFLLSKLNENIESYIYMNGG